MARPNSGPWRRKGRKTYYATVGGKAVSLGTEDLDEARTKWHALTAKENMGGDDVADVRLDLLCNQRLVWVARNKKPKTYKVYEFFLGMLTADHSAKDGLPAMCLADLMVSKLKPHHLDAVCDRHPTWEPPTKRAFKVAVLSLLNWAVKQGFIEANKLRGRLDLPPIRSRAEDAVMGDEDFAVLLEHANGPLRDLLTACRHTGTRPNTIALVSAEPGSPVRFLPNTRQIVATVHKTDGGGQNLVVNLDDTAFALLTRLAAERPTGPLFLNTRGLAWTAEGWGKAMAGVRKRVKAKGIKLKGRGIMYGNRHHFATALLLAGVPDAHVAALGGWKGTTMLHKHYSHVNAHNDVLRQHFQHIKPITPPATTSGDEGG